VVITPNEASAMPPDLMKYLLFMIFALKALVFGLGSLVFGFGSKAKDQSPKTVSSYCR